MLDEEMKNSPEDDHDNDSTLADSENSKSDESQVENDTDSLNSNSDSKSESEKKENPEAANENQVSVENSESDSELDPLAASERTVAELKDQNLRLVAEMENLRRRTQKEMNDIRQYAVTGFARDMLQVSDNLIRALETISDKNREEADEILTSLIDGIEMTERELQNVLNKHGISKIEPTGEKFDPNFHQAMFEVPDADAPNNTVVQLVQSGYKIGERVLRPAMVGVAKSSGEKESKQDDSTEESDES